MTKQNFIKITAALCFCAANSSLAAADRFQEGTQDPFLGEPSMDMRQVFPDERFPNVVVTLKLQAQEVESVISTFQRFGYTIQTFHHAPGLEEEMRERYDAFMRYLDN